MPDLSYLIIILIGLNFVSQISSSNDYRPFSCNYTELKKLEISHFFIHNQNGFNIYITTISKIIKFKAMTLEMENDVKSIKAYQPFILERQEFSISEKKILGYTVFRNKTTYKQYEIYEIGDDLVTKDELIFNKNVPQFGQGHIENLDPKLYTSKFKYVYQNRNETFTFDYGRNRKLNVTIQLGDQLYKSKLFDLDYDVEYAAYFAEKKYAYLYELDGNQVMHLKRFKYDDMKKKLDWNIIQSSFNLASYLSCHKPFTESRQIKGILYKNSTFYLFVNRFYLELNEDIIHSNFLIADSYYKTAKDLKFDKESDIESIQFDMDKRWLMQKDDKNFFSLNRLFELKFENDGIYLTETGTLTAFDLSYCDHFIEIKNNFVCYNQIEYYPLKNNSIDKRKNIKDLFNDFTNVIYDKDEILELIFYYNDKIIFMTRNYLYTMNKSQLNIDNDKLSISQSKEPISKEINYLFHKSKDNMTKVQQNRQWNILVPVALILFFLSFSIFIYYSSKSKNEDSSKADTNEKRKNKIDSFIQSLLEKNDKMKRKI